MASSDIRVSVEWSNSTVFAGEDIECHITFRNIAPRAGAASRHASNRIVVPANDRSRKTSQLTPKIPTVAQNHRPALSFSQSSINAREHDSWLQTQAKTASENSVSHRRSVSIISLGQSESIVEESQSQESFTSVPKRSPKGHSRAASLQLLPRRALNSGEHPLSGE